MTTKAQGLTALGFIVFPPRGLHSPVAKRPSSKSKAPAREIDLPPPPPVSARAPIALAALLGHDDPIRILRASITSGRLHHAWIFHGPRGVGKFTAALAFAATILDPTSTPGLTGDIAPDPESPVQRLLAAGTHPDLHIITKELAKFHDDPDIRARKLITIPKEVVEQHLIRPASLSPVLRNSAPIGKVFIIDEAELLDRSASNAPTQNAILKTMEEPDGRTVIILVTSSLERLLPTIRSRCQQVRFAPLPPPAMRTWLSRQPDTPEREELAWLLESSEGSPGEFVTARASGLYQWHLTIAPMLADIVRGKDRPELGAVMATLVDDAAKAAVEADKQTSKEAATRQGASRIFRMVLQSLRHNLRHSLPKPGTPDWNDAACRAIDAVDHARRTLEAQVNPSFAFEELSADLAAAFVGTAHASPGR